MWEPLYIPREIGKGMVGMNHHACCQELWCLDESKEDNKNGDKTKLGQCVASVWDRTRMFHSN